MKIIIDEKLVKRNKLIGKILRWVSLACMVFGLFAVFSEKIATNPSLFFAFFVVMILGVLLSSVSGFFTSRFGNSPRPDELIDKAFKGLDDRYQIYHYRSSIPHLLISPVGVWSIIPTFVDGEIFYDQSKNNWFHKKNSFLNRFLQKENFPNPISEYEYHKKELLKIKDKALLAEDPGLQVLIILMHKNAKLSGLNENDGILILPFEKVKERFRKNSKINNKDYAGIYTSLGDFLKPDLGRS